MNNTKTINLILKMSDQVSGGATSAASSLQKLSSAATSIGTQMTAAFTVPIVAAAAASVNMAKDFDTALRNVQSITKQTDDEIKKLGNGLLELSQTSDITVDSAQNLAEAYYDVVGSGFEAREAMLVLEAATMAASAGLTETGVAAKGIIAVMNSYGLSAKDAAHVSDLMFETVNRGVGSFEELSSSMSNVVGVANAVGVPFEEISAAIATMSKQGYSFSQASNAIRQTMTSLIKPTAQGAEIISQMGYESGEAMLEALGLAGALQAVAEHTGGSVTEMSKLFSDVDGLKAALALTGEGATMFAEDMAAMASSTGATQAAFAEQSKSFEFQWKRFQNVLSATAIQFGQVILPILSDLLEALIPIIQWFGNLDEGTKRWVIGLLAIVAAIGPVLVMIGQLIGAISAISAAIPVVSGAFAAFLALGAPVIALIGLVIAAIVLLIANWEALGTTVSQIGTMVVEGWKRVFETLAAGVARIGEIIWFALNRMTGNFFIIGQQIIMGLLKGIASKAVDLIAYVFGLSKELTATIKGALGIASPSKVMEGLGKNVVEGFHKGIESLGGVGVSVPQVQGGNVSGGQPSLAVAGASSGGNVFNIYPPVGTTQEQILYITKEVSKNIANEAHRKGARK